MRLFLTVSEGHAAYRQVSLCASIIAKLGLIVKHCFIEYENYESPRFFLLFREISAILYLAPNTAREYLPIRYAVGPPPGNGRGVRKLSR